MIPPRRARPPKLLPGGLPKQLKQAEAKIKASTERPVYFALEYKEAEDYAKSVGIIISIWANIEGFIPSFLQRLCGLSEEDSRAILGSRGLFSTSARLNFVKNVYDNRDKHSREYVVYNHLYCLLSDANSIRNKYAHAKYELGRNFIDLEVYSGLYKRDPDRQRHTIKDFHKDINRMKRIQIELHAFFHQNEISLGLHRKLENLTS